MHFLCRVAANFPAEKLRLVDCDQARLIWDEHGGTFVLRVEGLEVLEATEPTAEEAGIFLEVALPEAASLARQLEGFAGEHSLRLASAAAGPEFAETPILAACHVPGKNLFIFCEEPRLTVRRRGPQSLEVRIGGVFKARRVPSQEPDIIIHLDLAAMTRLLAWCRAGQ